MFSWLNDNLLKMTWLSNLVKKLVENTFGLSINEKIGGSIHFFIYDVIILFSLPRSSIYPSLQETYLSGFDLVLWCFLPDN